VAELCADFISTEDPAAVLALGEMMCPVKDPVQEESMAVVQRQNVDPFDPEQSEAYDELKTAFKENRDAMIQWLKCEHKNISGWPLDRDFRDIPRDTLGKNFLFLQQPFIPCGPDGQLTDIFTFAQALCAEEEGEFERLYKEAFTHVVGKKHWPMSSEGATGDVPIPPEGTLCSCAKLGELTGLPIHGKACTENLGFCQIKGENNKLNKPTRAVYVYCPEHIDCSAAAVDKKKPLRILRIMTYVIENINLIARATGGRLFLDDLALPVYRKYFLNRKPLLKAMMVHAMTQANWLAAKLEEELPFVRKPARSASRSGSVSSTQISIAGFLQQKAQSKAAIKQSGPGASPATSVFSPQSFGNLKKRPLPTADGAPSAKKEKPSPKRDKVVPKKDAKKDLSKAKGAILDLAKDLSHEQLQAILLATQKK
jgi:hypothetical protein